LINHGKNSSSAPVSRPKLGLSLSNKTTTKAKRSSTSSFPSRLISAATKSAAADVTADDGSSSQGQETRQQYDEQQMVLPSPRKFDTFLSPQNVPSDHHTDLLAAGISEKAATITATRLDTNIGSTNIKTKLKGTIKKNINDNFVRLNMKNNAGACRGVRNKSSKFSKERRSWSFQGGAADTGRDNYYDGSTATIVKKGNFAAPIITFDATVPPLSSSTTNHNNENDDKHRNDTKNEINFGSKVNKSSKSNATSYVSKMSGLDPLDEFVDGTFHACNSKADVGKINGSLQSTTNDTTSTIAGIAPIAAAPKCARHQRPCKLIKVKKTTSGNRGREFYACSMPRGEQCDHFQWADDTVEAARNILAKNTSYSSFITRQVAAYVDRFRKLTVPELKEETSRRGLNKNGKKQQLLTRLAIWSRDELVKGSPEFEKEEMEAAKNDEGNNGSTKNAISSCSKKIDGEEFNDDDSSSCCEDSSEDELELFDGEKQSEEENYTDEDNEQIGSETKRGRKLHR